METEFTPIASFAGGLMIGAAAVALMALNGRIAGISGIAARLLDRGFGGAHERPGLFFLLGLFLAAPLWWLTQGGWPQQTVPTNLPLMAGAGLLVGFGSVMGSGCTSGHGVCGISRFSTRSILATITFMAMGAITVFLLRHIFGG